MSDKRTTKCHTNEVLVPSHCRAKARVASLKRSKERNDIRAYIEKHGSKPDDSKETKFERKRKEVIVIETLLEYLQDMPFFIADAIKGMKKRKDVENIHNRYAKVLKTLDHPDYFKTSEYIKLAVFRILINI